MKIGLLQLNSTIGAFTANRERLEKAYKEVVAQGAELVIAPELYLCGYPPRDLLLREDFISAGLAALQALALAIGPVPLLVGYVERNLDRPGRPLFNAAAVLQNGKQVDRIFKSLLPTYDVFDEDRYFEPAQKIAPLSLAGKKIGITICEDIWNDADFWPERRYRHDPVRDLVQAGAEIILNLSASPWQQGKEKQRMAMLQRVAQDEKVPLVQVNAVGGNDDLIFDGHSVALNARGEVLGLCSGFAEEVRVLDLATAASTPSFLDPNELLFRALVLGTRDYVQKCGFSSVVLGLSGGIDSALVAVIAQAALGANQVWTVAMPSRYSSAGSQTDAALLAARLGVKYEVLPIEAGFCAIEKTLSGVFLGRAPDATEENIQSRLRGLTLMALANKFNALLLTTGNKSELAVGYCTLYGDMCGALAVLADVLKTEIYALAHWINREKEIIPRSTLEKAPSAELRPDQTDQDSLPPYPLLDEIIRGYILDEASAPAMAGRGLPAEITREVVQKIIQNEYKRRQSAPGLKVSPRAFGTGRRVPIAQRFKG